jgi:RsiW-degrading membrane proteinase PrsW (M82 family)
MLEPLSPHARMLVSSFLMGAVLGLVVVALLLLFLGRPRNRN